MSNIKVKIVYSLNIHLKLQEMGFNFLTEMRNPQHERFLCWVYELTPQFQDAFDRILEEVSNNG